MLFDEVEGGFFGVVRWTPQVRFKTIGFGEVVALRPDICENTTVDLDTAVRQVNGKAGTADKTATCIGTDDKGILQIMYGISE